MHISSVLDKYGFCPDALEIYARRGLKTLFPPQADAVNTGVLKGNNLVLSAPTASGKTLIAELCMLKAILDSGGRCLYIVPLKALASEKYDEFNEKFAGLGISIGIATGDSDKSDRSLNRNKIIIATAEKVDSLLRSRASWLINSLHVVVLDEIHFINDGSRGPTLEILTARIKQLNPKIQILALSATIRNADELAGWLKAELVKSEWRPIPLYEGVYYNEEIKFYDYPKRLVKEDIADDLGKLTSDTVRGGGQVLVFVGSRRSAQAAAKQITKAVGPGLGEDERIKLHKLGKDLAGSASDSTKICRLLGEVARHGVAFHHAGLKPNQRKLIEKYFKENIIKAICSTPTLAAGVNLPARRAIIRDIKRFEAGLGSAYIPTSEYKQCAGRAGRPQFDKYGEAVIMAKSASECKTLFKRYIEAEPEPVISKLGEEAHLRIHILASIAGDYVHDVHSTLEFLSHTFLAYQKKTGNLLQMISNIFDYLTMEGFIEKEGFHYHATPFGQTTSRLYIDPATSVVLRDGLLQVKNHKTIPAVGGLHLICCTPDSPLLKFGKSDVALIDEFIATNEHDFIFTQNNRRELEDYFLYLSIAKTTMLLQAWTEEEREEQICDRFNVGPGDIYRHTDSARWLMYAAGVFADLFDIKNLTFSLADLRARTQYGIKEELIPLAHIKGIGRVRARSLFNAGYKSPKDLKYAAAEELAKVDKISLTLARELLKQITQPNASYQDALLEEARRRITPQS